MALAYFRVAQYSAWVVSNPWPLESREAAQLQSTRALSQGRNPWQPSFAVTDYNCYGVLLPWTAAHLLPASALSLRGLRALGLLVLLLAAGLLGLAAFRLCASQPAAWAAALAVLGGWMHFVTPTARSDAMAAAFLVMPACLLWIWPGRGTALLAALLAALALFTKPYAALAGPLIIGAFMVRGRIRDALSWGLCWAFFQALFIFYVLRRWPGYFEATLGLHAAAVTRSGPWAWLQFKTYLLQVAWPLLLGLGWARWQRGVWLDRGSLAVVAAVFLALALSMAWHPGAWLQYFFHLLHPALILALLAQWGKEPPFARGLLLALTLGALLSVVFGTAALSRFEAGRPQNWALARQLVRGSQLTMAPGLLSELLAQEQRAISDNGQTEYLDLARGPQGPALRQALAEHRARWQADLLSGKVDLVFQNSQAPLPPQYLRKLTRLGSLCLDTPVAVLSQECFELFAAAPLVARLKNQGVLP